VWVSRILPVWSSNLSARKGLQQLVKRCLQLRRFLLKPGHYVNHFGHVWRQTLNRSERLPADSADLREHREQRRDRICTTTRVIGGGQRGRRRGL